MKKQLADTDSIYCSGLTNSHQSSIFIAATDSIEARSIFGDNYESNMDVVIVLAKDNLLLNLLSHFLGNKTYYKRGSNTKWTLDKNWLLDRNDAVDKAFSAKCGKFHASINKESSRTYLKGITALKSDGCSNKLDLRDYLFSGDVIELVRQNDGTILLLVQGCGGEFKFESNDLRKEFEDWLTSVYKKPNGDSLGESTINSYVRALEVATVPNPDGSPASAHGKVVWHNIYQHLYGSPAPKGVFQVDTVAEFQSIFGGLLLTVKNQEPPPPNVKVQHFTEIRQWIDGQPGGAFLPPALGLYEKFLEWRETQQPQDTKPEELPPNVDRLTVALKIFAEKRKEKQADGGWFETGRDVNGRIREYFDPITVEQVEAFGEDEIKELFCGTRTADGKIDLETMWSGKNGQGWSHVKKGIDTGNMEEIRGYLVELKRDTNWMSTFCRPEFERKYGFGRSVISELLMKFHPDSCIKHGERSHDALSWLGLIDFPYIRKYSDAEYKQVCGAAAKILAKMSAMKIAKKIDADGSEDNSPPDYLTVNEFIYFVNTNKDLIKEEIMNREFKKAEKKPKTGTCKLYEAVENDEMMQRLMAALRTKPFAILAGHSGTGKSRLVRRLAYMTCNDDKLLDEAKDSNAPGNYCMVQVKPNWHDSTDLLGYYTEMNGGKFHTTPFVEFICKAYAYPETPFFVCLDEMNLAPVEQYFAEFLSAIESYSEKTKLTDRLITEKASPEEICGETKFTESLEEVKKHGLTIPRNLFVVGTVNVDETTCQFSRKVLDRAMTLLMTTVSFASMNADSDPSDAECLDDDGFKFFRDRPTKMTPVKGQIEWLDKVQKQVGDSPFAIAYRFANEYALYQAAYQMLLGKGLKEDGTPNPDDAESQKTAIDHVVLMKLLPRIHGARPEMEAWFEGKDGDADKIGLKKTLDNNGLSVDMMDQILARRGEYLSFWP